MNNSDSRKEDDKIKVKLNVKGINIEMECSPDQLGDAIKSIIDNIGSKPIIKVSEAGDEFRNIMTCREAVELLWKRGWFKRERRLSEVWRMLSSIGYNFDRSAISHALKTLVREGKLTRMGKARKYTYIQKIPSTIINNK